MPWTRIEDVPPQVRTHKGVPLNLGQANRWGRLFDGSGNAAVAWTQFEKEYKIDGNKWVKRKRVT